MDDAEFQKIIEVIAQKTDKNELAWEPTQAGFVLNLGSSSIELIFQQPKPGGTIWIQIKNPNGKVIYQITYPVRNIPPDHFANAFMRFLERYQRRQNQVDETISDLKKGLGIK